MRLSGARSGDCDQTRTAARRRACGLRDSEPGWAVEAAASDGNRYAISPAAWKTRRAFPTATHSPDDG